MKHIGTHHQQNTWRIDGTEIPQRNELQRNSFPELFKSSFSIRDNSLYRLPWESLVKCASSLFFLHPFYGFARGGLDRFLTIGNLMKKTLDVFKCSIYVACNILPIRAMHAENVWRSAKLADASASENPMSRNASMTRGWEVTKWLHLKDDVVYRNKLYDWVAYMPYNITTSHYYFVNVTASLFKTSCRWDFSVIFRVY